MKKLINFALTICLFSSIALAEGDMGDGGRPSNSGGIKTADVLLIIVKQAMQIRF